MWGRLLVIQNLRKALLQWKSCSSLPTSRAWQNQLTLIPFPVMARRRNSNLLHLFLAHFSYNKPLNSIFPWKPRLLPYCRDPPTCLGLQTTNVSISASTLASGFAQNTYKPVSCVTRSLKQNALQLNSDWGLCITRNARTSYRGLSRLRQALPRQCLNHGRLARWRKWKSCEVGEAKEGLENELWRR